MKTLIDYREAVFEAYKRKKKNHTLPLNLLHHTTGNLRNECLAQFPTRYDQKEEQTFRTYYGLAADKQEYFRLIQASAPDIYRPLNGFLRGVVQEPNLKHIELLAWLINFEHRPIYKFLELEDEPIVQPTPSPPKEEETDIPLPSGEKTTEESQENYEDSEELDLSTTDGAPLEDETNEPEESTKNPVPGDDDGQDQKGNPTGAEENLLDKFLRILRKSRLIIGAIMVCIISVGIWYYAFNKQCMYWDGHQYQTINCDEQVTGAEVIPRDDSTIKNLTTIKDICTITEKDINKIYYITTNHKQEFFTGSGQYPLDRTRDLHRLSQLIYDEYVVPYKQKHCK